MKAAAPQSEKRWPQYFMTKFVSHIWQVTIILLILLQGCVGVFVVHERHEAINDPDIGLSIEARHDVRAAAGREADDEYKIPAINIRPIWLDDDLYSVKEKLTTDGSADTYDVMVEEIALTNKNYKGSGSPVFYTTPDIHTHMLWIKDSLGRRIYETDATLCAALRVSSIEEVPQFENLTRTLADNSVRKLLGIKVNLKDYNVGADKGGQVATFEDFDIDFNQQKYLMETRCSGALVKAHSAQIYEFETVAAH